MIDGNKGKPFENKIASWLKEEDYYFERFFDSRSVGGISASRPADYFVYHNRQLYYIECKSTKGRSLAYNKLTQMKRLLACRKYKIKGYFFISISNEVYSVNAFDLYNHMKKSAKKSIRPEELDIIGIKLNSRHDLKWVFNGIK